MLTQRYCNILPQRGSLAPPAPQRPLRINSRGAGFSFPSEGQGAAGASVMLANPLRSYIAPPLLHQQACSNMSILLP